MEHGLAANQLNMKRRIISSIWMLPIIVFFLSPLPILSYVFLDTSIILGYLLILLGALFFIRKSHSSIIELSVGVTLSALILMSAIHFKFDAANIVIKFQVLLDPRISACSQNALAIEGEGALGVCMRHVIAFGQEFDTIIYDSTDQIILDPSKRSTQWNAVARTLQDRVPFGIEGFSVQKVSEHYYHVIFSNAYKPDNYL